MDEHKKNHLTSSSPCEAARAGGRFVTVDARDTSQRCAQCDALVRKKLRMREHRCPHCETEVHRDVNAARNILKRAVAGPWSGNAEKNGPTGEDRPKRRSSRSGRRSGNLNGTIAASRPQNSN